MINYFIILLQRYYIFNKLYTYFLLISDDILNKKNIKIIQHTDNQIVNICNI
jgi:hypothetical protein